MKLVTLLLAMLLSMGSALAAYIDFDSLSNGQMRAEGKGFTSSATRNRQVNIYKNGDFQTQINLNSNGSFSYTSPRNTFSKRDTMTVKVLQYHSNSRHYEQSAAYNYDNGGYNPGYGRHSIEFRELSNGQMTAVGKNFNRPYSNNNQVNFYKNDKFFADITMNDNGSFSYTAPARTFRRGDTFTVKVLQYLGNGKHYEESARYNNDDDHDHGGGHNPGHGNNDYVRTCALYTSTRALEAICIENRVPANVAYACFKSTSSQQNEGICLRTRTNPETTVACKQYMSTQQTEAACLRKKDLSLNTIRNCSYASTIALELRCIENAY